MTKTASKTYQDPDIYVPGSLVLDAAVLEEMGVRLVQDHVNGNSVLQPTRLMQQSAYEAGKRFAEEMGLDHYETDQMFEAVQNIAFSSVVRRALRPVGGVR